jgi:uncharacterized coiled-coil protein SlyX
MIRTRPFAVLVSVLVLTAGSFPSAQKDQLPNGRPFQVLQTQIDNLDTVLAQQIAGLQTQLAGLAGRVDAVEQHNVIQGQLLSSLQAAVVLIEQRMMSAEGRLANLEAWKAAQDALLTGLNNAIATLQNQVAQQGATLQTQINNLFTLHNLQQQAITVLQSQAGSLQGQINTINATLAVVSTASTDQQNQISLLQSQLGSIQGQLNTANFNLAATRNQLAVGCPVGSSIRQVIPNGPVNCEADAGQTFVTLIQTVNSPVLGPGGVASTTATCPPAPPAAPGQPPNPPYFANGGGYFVPTAGTVLATTPSGPSSWTVSVVNTGLVSFQYQVNVQCIRQTLPQ